MRVDYGNNTYHNTSNSDVLEETPIINGMKISLTPEQARDLPYPLGCKFCSVRSRVCRDIIMSKFAIAMLVTSYVLFGAWRYVLWSLQLQSWYSTSCVLLSHLLLLPFCYIVVVLLFMIHYNELCMVHILCTLSQLIPFLLCYPYIKWHIVNRSSVV